MDFEIRLDRINSIVHNFCDGNYEPYDSAEDEPSVICGKSGAVLKKYLSDESEYDLIYVLDQITIDKKFRNCGIGSVIIKNLLKMINYQFGHGSTVFLCASDYESAEQYGFESSEYKEGTNRLIEFYKKLGFRIVKDNIMVYTEKDI